MSALRRWLEGRAVSYELPARAWLPLPCGGRELRHDAQYEPKVDRTPERLPRRSKPRRGAVESVADVEIRTREAGGVKLTEVERKRYAPGHFGQEQSTARIRTGAIAGGEKQRQEAERRIMTTLLCNIDERRTQGCRTLVSTELVHRPGKVPRFKVTCPVSGPELVNAWNWAQGKGASCRTCAARAENEKRVRERAASKQRLEAAE